MLSDVRWSSLSKEGGDEDEDEEVILVILVITPI